MPLRRELTAWTRGPALQVRPNDCGLVTSHSRFDGFRPSVDSARDIGDGRIIVGAKILGDSHAATAVVAKDKNMLVVWQLGQPAGNLRHGNVDAAGDLTDGDFVRLADVQNDFSGLFGQLGGFSYINLQGWFHGINQ